MKINYKKSLKFVTLLITALLIATVSAQTYRYMFIDGSITVSSSKLIWIKGTDAPSDATIVGGTVTMDLDVDNASRLIFTECLFLKNVNASGSFNIKINVTTAVSSSDFAVCKMHIYANSSGTWTLVDTLDLTLSGDNYTGTLSAGKYLRMTFEVEATVSETGIKPFDIQVTYY